MQLQGPTTLITPVCHILPGCKWWDWGASTVGNITAVGKINGKEVKRHSIYPFGRPKKLILKPDFEEIKADGADLTRVVIQLKDEKGQTLHLSHHPVFFQIDGPGKFIGENPFSLEAGRGAVFVQSKRVPGKVQLRAYIKEMVAAKTKIVIQPFKEKLVPDS